MASQTVIPTPAYSRWHALIGAVLPCAIVPATYVEFNSGGHRHRLRLPEGSPIQNNLRVIIHRSRESNLTVYRRGRRSETLSLPFVGLSRFDYIALRTYIDDVRGKIITYQDAYGTIISGTISEFSPVEGTYSHGYDVTIGFEVQ